MAKKKNIMNKEPKSRELENLCGSTIMRIHKKYHPKGRRIEAPSSQQKRPGFQ